MCYSPIMAATGHRAIDRRLLVCGLPWPALWRAALPRSCMPASASTPSLARACGMPWRSESCPSTIGRGRSYTHIYTALDRPHRRPRISAGVGNGILSAADRLVTTLGEDVAAWPHHGDGLCCVGTAGGGGGRLVTAESVADYWDLVLQVRDDIPHLRQHHHSPPPSSWLVSISSLTRSLRWRWSQRAVDRRWMRA